MSAPFKNCSHLRCVVNWQRGGLDLVSSVDLLFIAFDTITATAADAVTGGVIYGLIAAFTFPRPMTYRSITKPKRKSIRLLEKKGSGNSLGWRQESGTIMDVDLKIKLSNESVTII